jgi:hypothetical protein
MIEEMNAKMDTDLNEMGEDIKSGKAEMRPTLEEWVDGPEVWPKRDDRLQRSGRD